MLYALHKNELIEVKALRILSALVKIHQILVMFELANQFLF